MTALNIPAAEPTERQMLVAVRRWAIANGWHWHRSYGWVNRPLYRGWTVAVEVLDGQLAVSRQSAARLGGHTDYHRVDSVRQGVDILAALWILPPTFSSAYRVASQARAELPPAAPTDLAEVERRIAHHQQAAADLRAIGIRLAADAGISGPEAMRWLTSRGATSVQANALIVEVVRERRTARQAAEDGPR